MHTWLHSIEGDDDDDENYSGEYFNKFTLKIGIIASLRESQVYRDHK